MSAKLNLMTKAQRHALSKVVIKANEIIESMELIVVVKYDYRTAEAIEPPLAFSMADTNPAETSVSWKEVVHQGSWRIKVQEEYLDSLEGIRALAETLETAFIETHEGEKWTEEFAIAMWERLVAAVNIDTGLVVNKHQLDMAVVMGFKEPPVIIPDSNSNFGPHPISGLKKACPALDSVVRYPPGTRRRKEDPTQRVKLETVIIYLNDQERWSRERIADWLETLDVDTSVDMEKL